MFLAATFLALADARSRISDGAVDLRSEPRARRSAVPFAIAHLRGGRRRRRNGAQLLVRRGRVHDLRRQRDRQRQRQQLLREGLPEPVQDPVRVPRVREQLDRLREHGHEPGDARRGRADRATRSASAARSADLQRCPATTAPSATAERLPRQGRRALDGAPWNGENSSSTAPNPVSTSTRSSPATTTPVLERRGAGPLPRPLQRRCPVREADVDDG